MSEKEISEKMQDIMSRMKKRREELDMSYQTLSDKVGISKSTLQRYETGYIKNMPVDKLEDIADALQVSPAYLMGWNDEVNKQPTTMAAHFDGDEYTEEQLNRIRQFAEFIKQDDAK
ncbi:MAG: helix-turn-helix transcriptional regulator [Bacillota bacterium]|nr:helix-turn-helix transcriptional regulator [Bacillota bacterium]